MRLFLAYEVPEALAKELPQELKNEKFNEIMGLTNKVQQQNWHATILFSKNFPDERITVFKELIERALQESDFKNDFVLLQQFEFWKSAICLTGTEKQSQLVSWLAQHFPQELREFTQFKHMQDWKPHITVFRGRAKSLELLEEKAKTLFPLQSSLEEGIRKCKWGKISLFKSPVEPLSGIYERLWTLDL